MELNEYGTYRTIRGNLEVKLLKYFESEPHYPWVGVVMYDGKIMPQAWTTDGLSHNGLHDLYDVSEGFVYVAKVYIAVSGANYDEAQKNLQTQLDTGLCRNESWLSWAYEWSNEGGDYNRMRYVAQRTPSEVKDNDESLTEMWNNAEPNDNSI